MGCRQQGSTCSTDHFRPIAAADIPAIKEAFSAYTGFSSEYNVVCDIAWSHAHNTEFLFVEGMATLQYSFSAYKDVFLFPVGFGDEQSAIQRLIAMRKGQGCVQFICDEDQLSRLPEGFSSVLQRDICDYILDAGALLNAQGKRFRGTRRNISKFNNNNYCPRFEAFSCKNSDDVFQIAKDCIQRCESPVILKGLQNEWIAIQKLIEYQQELGVLGMLVYEKDVPIGALMATYTRPNLLHIHILKCDIAYSGVKERLTHEFLSALPGGVKGLHVNCEEDLGLPGLRLSKTLFGPEFLANKYLATMMLPYSSN